ncbi:ORF112 [Ranid herpesvirus 1]|uniref:ORF112 n=1 Tax=Ranid herpesvirus 1 TaxID=85655 RepID=Q14VL8_9VIRU|nr:ORF112 [Ranid herpesvirus 1]ABG25792.1 ORF112 [Ranid herpesvirus 1]
MMLNLVLALSLCASCCSVFVPLGGNYTFPVKGSQGVYACGPVTGPYQNFTKHRGTQTLTITNITKGGLYNCQPPLPVHLRLVVGEEAIIVQAAASLSTYLSYTPEGHVTCRASVRTISARWYTPGQQVVYSHEVAPGQAGLYECELETHYGLLYGYFLNRDPRRTLVDLADTQVITDVQVWEYINLLYTVSILLVAAAILLKGRICRPVEHMCNIRIIV